MSRIKSLRSAIELDPTKAKNYFQLAKLYRGSRQYEEAEETLLAFLRQEPGPEDTNKAFLWLAELFLEQDDFQKALGYWNLTPAH
jgi:tetratricopeptide (TPR) repeat protein